MSGRPGSVLEKPATVGHVVSKYLPRSETFIYTTLRFQTAFTPVVYAERIENLAEFPLDDVHHLTLPAPAPRRALRRARARATGFPGTYEREIAVRAGRDGCVALHAHFGWSGAAALPAARRLDLPLITTFYGIDVTDPQRNEGRRREYAPLFEAGARFICEGPAMANHLGDHGCPSDRIRVVPIGLDLALWPFRPAQRGTPLVVAQACRFIDKKGVDTAVRAYAAARPRLGPSELWLIGDGPLRDDVERLVASLRITDTVRIMGMVSYADYRELLARIHVCIQPSRTAADGDTEGGAPTVLLEMQASGVPVVSTRHADIPNVVYDPSHLADEEDVEGLADSLVAVSQLSEADWRARVKHGREFVERHHDARSLAGKIEAVYREAIR